jgi:hypothetical protein
LFQMLPSTRSIRQQERYLIQEFTAASGAAMK